MGITTFLPFRKWVGNLEELAYPRRWHPAGAFPIKSIVEISE